MVTDVWVGGRLLLAESGLTRLDWPGVSARATAWASRTLFWELAKARAVGGKSDETSKAATLSGVNKTNYTSAASSDSSAGTANIAAGAVVTKSLAPGATVAGNPARPLRDIARSRIVPRGAK